MAKTPRTNYGRLRDVGIQFHDPQKNWALKPRDPHTRRERERLKAAALLRHWGDLAPAKSTSLAS